MVRSIDQIAGRAKHVVINDDMLGRVSDVMKQSIDSGWPQAHRDAPEHYPLNPVQQANADAVMFYLMNTAQMWLIWERLGDHEVRPWQLHIGGELYVGASAITAAHVR